MNIVEIRKIVDSYYQKQETELGYQFLLEQVSLAMEKQDDLLVLGLLNEILGYCRVTGKFELGRNISSKMASLVNQLGLNKDVIGATTFLNIATFYSVSKDLSLAKQYYQEVLSIYTMTLDNKDERMASLYNNISIFYQQNKHYTKAYEYLQKALSIITTLPGCEIEEATSYTNLAQIYFLLHNIPEGIKAVDKSISLFIKHNDKDVHYPSALSLKAHAYFLLKEYDKAIDVYKKALVLLEATHGKSNNYQIVKENLEQVESSYYQYQQQGMYLCKQYYLEVVKPLLEKEFPKYINQMAIGLVGQGSECFGYDDALSRDHDFGPGICIWLPKTLYQEIGTQLIDFYQKVPPTYQGIKRMISTHGNQRVGVFCIEDFYYSFIGKIPTTNIDWFSIPQLALATVTNGEVFSDPLGQFTSIRNHLLSYYPKDVRIKKIVTCIAKMAQAGQYNYARCMQRKQVVASTLAINEFIENTIACIYLLNRQYMPYYKWSHHGIKQMTILSDLYQDLLTLATLPFQEDCWNQETSFYATNINPFDKKVQLVETICSKILQALKQQELTDSNDSFLENHTSILMQKIKDKQIATRHIMEG